MTLDPTRCPICGRPNRCAMEVERATGVAQGPCWCAGVEFGADLLAQVPAAAQREACICPQCAAAPPGRGTPDGR